MFIGIGLSPECRRAIAGAVSPLRKKGVPVSWTPEDNLHLTLKFLATARATAWASRCTRCHA